MQLKLKQLIESQESIGKLIETKLPVKVSYRLNRLVNYINPELRIFTEKRLELFKEFGVHDTEKDIWEIKPENSETFTEEITKLMDEEVNIDFQTLKLADLGDISIEPKYLVNWIFEE